MTKRVFLLYLMLIPGLGIKGRGAIWRYLCANPDLPLPLSLDLIIRVGKIADARIDAVVQWHASEDAGQLADLLKQQFITIADDVYPQQLKESDEPPVVLFYAGNLGLLTTMTVSVIGARQNSEYGEHIVKAWVPELVRAGITTVSGLANGIDGLVHAATLDAHGDTIGVIGSGLEIVYPRRTRNLQAEVAGNGLLLSEYLPHTPPLKHHFPQRNRIIAGIARQVLVIEAKQRSGTLITAKMALDNNREVLAVPGRIDQSRSKGCNDLIVAGAKPVLSVADVLISCTESMWI
ncbi:MAG: DNA-processing protein DprA [Lactobacillaceae bacterium]|nr:DNA-processing protein DprA [Lactobacillaceae bacterium]